jgi:hypothetical protein
MAKGCYSLGMFSKVVGNGWVVMVGLKVGVDGEILVNIELFAHFWAKYINYVIHIISTYKKDLIASSILLNIGITFHDA